MNPTPSRLGRACLVAAALAAASFASATDRPDPDDFARLPFVHGMQLSPDGASIAFISVHLNRTHVCVMTLEDNKALCFNVGKVDFSGTPMPKEVDEFWWVGNKRLVLKTTVWDMLYGAAAVDRDGKHWRGLTWLERDPTGRTSDSAFELIHIFKDGSPRVLMLDIKGTVGKGKLYPDVDEVNTETGTSSRILRNPGNVTNWICDNKGVVRIGIARDVDKSWVLYRDSEKAKWRTLPLPSRGHDKLRPLGFDALSGQFYVAGFNDEDRWAVFPFDLATGKVGDAIVSDPVYDTLGGGFHPSFNGVSLTRPIFSEARGKLVGIVYVAETPRVKWLDPEYEHIQAAVDRSLPGDVNLFVNESVDGNRMLFLSFSDRNPGTYWLLDRTARSFKPLGGVMDWIKPSQMSPTYAVKYTARDGQTIHGLITVPCGYKPEGLPLVVMPHGGPWVRDTWGFDPYVQLIASRGYAVLRMNYRGSRGYGSAFDILGTKEVGKGIQDDIEDATKWAIAAGVADPKRIAIVGGSYGGYSALFALGKSPGMYRCGISINGVTDWPALFDKRASDPLAVFARSFWEKNIADPDKDPDFLASISPVNFADKITAPTLIIQAKDDRVVPQKQAREMADALKDAGNPAELVMLPEGNHSLADEPARKEAFKAIVDFLEKNLGPGVEFRGKP